MDFEIPRKLVLEFTKMTGAGNDFIVLDNRFYHFSANELSDLAKRFCPRKSSVGADGLLALEESKEPDCDFRMVYFNADGSRASMCGNGARCLGRFAKLTGISGQKLEFETDAGRYCVHVPDDPALDVHLYVPDYKYFRADCIPSKVGDSNPSTVHYIWTGTDHIVVFVDDVVTFPVSTVGCRLRADEAICKNGANVNFVEILESGRDGCSRIRVRTYERGVECETMACGTGAIASAVVSFLCEKAPRFPVEVLTEGGMLKVDISNTTTAPMGITLEGPADIVYRATLEV